MSYQLDFAVKQIYDSRKASQPARGGRYQDETESPEERFCPQSRRVAKQENRFSSLPLCGSAGERVSKNRRVAKQEDRFSSPPLCGSAVVYFAEDYSLNRNLLGRQGWLQLIRIGLDDYKSEIYISPNQEFS